MTKRVSDTKAAREFIDIAAQFCTLIETRDEKTELQLLQEAFVILPQLCLFGMRLPDVDRMSDCGGQVKTDSQTRATAIFS